MKYHAYLLFLKKRQNLQLSSAANYRWRFRVKHSEQFARASSAAIQSTDNDEGSDRK